MNKKVTSILAYLGIVLWAIAFFAGDKEGAKFHLNQGLIVALGYIICNILSFVPYVSIVACILSLVLFVFAIMGIVHACKDEEKELPLIGKIQILK